MAMTLKSVLKILGKPDCEEAKATEGDRIPVVLRLPGIEKAVEVEMAWIHLTDSDSTPYTNHAIVISVSKDQNHLFHKLAQAESH